MTGVVALEPRIGYSMPWEQFTREVSRSNRWRSHQLF
jgi:hypothetical protein